MQVLFKATCSMWAHASFSYRQGLQYGLDRIFPQQKTNCALVRLSPKGPRQFNISIRASHPEFDGHHEVAICFALRRVLRSAEAPIESVLPDVVYTP